MELPQELYHVILDTFMPSETMKEYLKDIELDEWQMLHLICGAPVPLYLKYDFLVLLSDYHKYFSDELRDTEKALNELCLSEGDLFYLKNKWYDIDDWIEKGGGTGPCLSVEGAIEILREECMWDECNWDEYNDNCGFAELEKWVKTGDKFESTYTYFFIKDDICYYEKEGPYIPFEKPFSRVTDSANLNLPTPFKPGDIVITDSLPFAPRKLAVITEIMDNRDCCSLQAISRNHKGEYAIGAVKHGRIYGGDNASIAYSPLYHIEKYTGELPAEDKFLCNISRYINGNEEKGRRLWEKLRLIDQLTEEKIKEQIRRFKTK